MMNFVAGCGVVQLYVWANLLELNMWANILGLDIRAGILDLRIWTNGIGPGIWRPAVYLGALGSQVFGFPGTIKDCHICTHTFQYAGTVVFTSALSIMAYVVAVIIIKLGLVGAPVTSMGGLSIKSDVLRGTIIISCAWVTA